MGILDRAFVASKATRQQAHVNVLLYGNSGTGKTTFGSRCGKRPFIVLSEQQAVLPIREANPEATILVVETWEALQELYRAINEAITKGAWPYDVIVLDSLTEMQRKLKDEIVAKGLKATAAGGKNEPTVQADGTLSMKGWGVLIDKTFNLVRAFRDLSSDFVCVALCNESTEDDKRYFRPMVNGQALPGNLAGLFNVVLYSFVTKSNPLEVEGFVEGAQQFVVLTNGASDRYLIKGHRSLKPYENPERASDMLARLRGAWETSAVEGVDEQMVKVEHAATVVPVTVATTAVVEATDEHPPVEAYADDVAREQSHATDSTTTETAGSDAQTAMATDPAPVIQHVEGPTLAPPEEHVEKLVNAQTMVNIREALRKHAVDEVAVLKAYGIAKLEDLPMKKYVGVMGRIAKSGPKSEKKTTADVGAVMGAK